MFKIIGIEDVQWDEIISTFPNHDIYYFSGYVKAFSLHGDGVPILLFYHTESLRAACVLLKRPIPETEYWDVVTPYGYGGFIFDGDTSEANMNELRNQYYSLMNENKIVSAFFRFHPLINNAGLHDKIATVIDLGTTVDVALTSPEIICENMLSKNRNTIRKAIKNGITIHQGRGMQLFDQFVHIYNATMDNDQASPYYYFKREFYESIDNDLKDNYYLFYALHEGKIVSMSIILFCNNYVHYHLSGAIWEYRNLAPTNLLLYEVALWGAKHGYKQFHLGGGVGSGEDSLFKFKKAFNKNSSNQFSIGKAIFNQEVYDHLVTKHKEYKRDLNLNFFPLYRA